MKKSIKSNSFDYLTFLAVVGIDYFLGWTTSDLVWSFWLSSICVGYLVIVTSALKIPITLKQLISSADIPKDKKIKPEHLLIGSFVFSLFLIAFFSVHFLGFHIGHASFLKSAFPLEGFSLRPKGLIDFNFLFDLFKILIPMYWPMVIVSLFNKREFLLPSAPEKDVKRLFRSFGLGPYQNILKIHFLIFILFGLKEAGVDKLTTHLIVLVVFSVNFSFLTKGKTTKRKRRLRRKKGF